jgi:hypothetical protein
VAVGTPQLFRSSRPRCLGFGPLHPCTCTHTPHQSPPLGPYHAAPSMLHGYVHGRLPGLEAMELPPLRHTMLPPLCGPTTKTKTPQRPHEDKKYPPRSHPHPPAHLGHEAVVPALVGQQHDASGRQPPVPQHVPALQLQRSLAWGGGGGGGGGDGHSLAVGLGGKRLRPAPPPRAPSPNPASPTQLPRAARRMGPPAMPRSPARSRACAARQGRSSTPALGQPYTSRPYSAIQPPGPRGLGGRGGEGGGGGGEAVGDEFLSLKWPWTRPAPAPAGGSPVARAGPVAEAPAARRLTWLDGRLMGGRTGGVGGVASVRAGGRQGSGTTGRGGRWHRGRGGVGAVVRVAPAREMYTRFDGLGTCLGLSAGGYSVELARAPLCKHQARPQERSQTVQQERWSSLRWFPLRSTDRGYSPTRRSAAPVLPWPPALQGGSRPARGGVCVWGGVRPLVRGCANGNVGVLSTTHRWKMLAAREALLRAVAAGLLRPDSSRAAALPGAWALGRRATHRGA